MAKRAWDVMHADISDYHALTAPRPLIVETGKIDGTYSRVRNQFFCDNYAPFAGDKTVARRARVAYDGNDRKKFIHYLHYHGHTYHVGDVFGPGQTAPSGYEPYIREPIDKEPTPVAPLNWQIDASYKKVVALLYTSISQLFYVCNEFFA